MKDGLERAIAQNPVRVACVHADGQYSPEVLPFLVDEMTARGLDILQGSRRRLGHRALGRHAHLPSKYAANAILNRLENHTLGLSMTDYHSGYLLYGRRALASLPYRAFSDSFDSHSSSSSLALALAGFGSVRRRCPRATATRFLT